MYLARLFVKLFDKCLPEKVITLTEEEILIESKDAFKERSFITLFFYA